MKDNKVMYVLLALVVAMLVGVVSFSGAQEKTPSSVTNLDALSKPQESTGYEEMHYSEKGREWSDSLYDYRIEYDNVKCLTGGYHSCTPLKVPWLYKKNKKTGEETSGIMY